MIEERAGESDCLEQETVHLGKRRMVWSAVCGEQ